MIHLQGETAGEAVRDFLMRYCLLRPTSSNNGETMDINFATAIGHLADVYINMGGDAFELTFRKVTDPWEVVEQSVIALATKISRTVMLGGLPLGDRVRTTPDGFSYKLFAFKEHVIFGGAEVWRKP